MKIKKKIINFLFIASMFTSSLSISFAASCNVKSLINSGGDGEGSNNATYSDIKVNPGKLLKEDKYWDLVFVHGKYRRPADDNLPETKETAYYTNIPLVGGKWKTLSLDKWYGTFDSKDVFNDKNHRYASGSPSDYSSRASRYEIYNRTNSRPTPKTGNNNNPLDGFYSGTPFNYPDKEFNLKYADTTDGRPLNTLGKSISNGWEHVVCQSHIRLHWTHSTGGDTTESKKARGDLHNLRPSIQNLFNGPRSSYLYAILDESSSGIETKGNADFEIGQPKWASENLVEPRVNIRGDIARITFYMHDRYHVTYEKSYYKLMILWAVLDPVTKEEKAFDLKAKSIMGFSNDYVTGKKQIPFSAEIISHLKLKKLI